MNLFSHCEINFLIFGEKYIATRPNVFQIRSLFGNPALLADIRAIMEPYSENKSRLRTTLLYTNMTAKAVYTALMETGWSAESWPTLRTISNILMRRGYRLRTVAKTSDVIVVGYRGDCDKMSRQFLLEGAAHCDEDSGNII
jgi:hypothetical protein